MKIRFAVQSYQTVSKQLADERCVNMYAESQPSSAKSDIAVFGCPGIKDFAICGDGPVRGAHVMGDKLYVVSGRFLYSVPESGGQATPVGGQIGGLDPVSMDDNGTQLAIVNGTNGYIYSTTSGFQLISSSNFHPANTTSFIDSFFAFDRADTNEYFISDSLDGLSYSDLFASAESRPDNVVSVLNHLEVLHLFGTNTTELHQNVGAANMPFQRIPGGIVARGIAAPLARTVEDSGVFMLGEDKIGYRLNGSALAKISTPAIDAAWEKYPTVADCYVFSYSFAGHKFVHYDFPSANKTWVRDIATKLWHERESHDRNGNCLGMWRGSCAVPAFGKTIIGDRYSGKIGYLDADTYTEFGNNIRAELISPPIHGDGKRVFMPWFELDVATGVGRTSGDGEYPQYMLDISDDGGYTWDGAQLWQSAGRLGQYGESRTQLRWDRLGSFYERVMRITCTDPVRRVVHAARCPGLRIGT